MQHNQGTDLDDLGQNNRLTYIITSQKQLSVSFLITSHQLTRQHVQTTKGREWSRCVSSYSHVVYIGAITKKEVVGQVGQLCVFFRFVPCSIY